MKKYYAGIDFGGMSAKAGLFDLEGNMIAKRYGQDLPRRGLPDDRRQDGRSWCAA